MKHRMRTIAETLVKAKFGPDEVYVYHRDPADEGLREFRVEHMNSQSCSIGWGWWWRPKDRYIELKVGRNGDESDVGFDACLLGLHMFGRLRARPFTERFTIDRDSGDKHWYEARRTGFGIGNVYWLEYSIDVPENAGRTSTAKWRRFTLSTYQVLGRQDVHNETLGTGSINIEMPEGLYPATWEITRSTRVYQRWPGKLFQWWVTKKDLALFPRISFDIPGGIPVWGKGENSWDCGMDGIFGTSFLTEGHSAKSLAFEVARNALADRERTGMFELPHPMTVGEAEKHLTQERAE